MDEFELVSALRTSPCSDKEQGSLCEFGRRTGGIFPSAEESSCLLSGTGSSDRSIDRVVPLSPSELEDFWVGSSDSSKISDLSTGLE